METGMFYGNQQKMASDQNPSRRQWTPGNERKMEPVAEGEMPKRRSGLTLALAAARGVSATAMAIKSEPSTECEMPAHSSRSKPVRRTSVGDMSMRRIGLTSAGMSVGAIDRKLPQPLTENEILAHNVLSTPSTASVRGKDNPRICSTPATERQRSAPATKRRRSAPATERRRSAEAQRDAALHQPRRDNALHQPRRDNALPSLHEETTLCLCHCETTLCLCHCETTLCTSHEETTLCTSHEETTLCTSHGETTLCTSHGETTLCTSHGETTLCTSHERRRSAPATERRRSAPPRRDDALHQPRRDDALHQPRRDDAMQKPQSTPSTASVRQKEPNPRRDSTPATVRRRTASAKHTSVCLCRSKTPLCFCHGETPLCHDETPLCHSETPLCTLRLRSASICPHQSLVALYPPQECSQSFPLLYQDSQPQLQQHRNTKLHGQQSRKKTLPDLYQNGKDFPRCQKLLSVAEALCMQGKDLMKRKRGRPSVEIDKEHEAKRSKGPTKAIPAKEIRTDSVGHWVVTAGLVQDQVRLCCSLFFFLSFSVYTSNLYLPLFPLFFPSFALRSPVTAMERPDHRAHSDAHLDRGDDFPRSFRHMAIILSTLTGSGDEPGQHISIRLNLHDNDPAQDAERHRSFVARFGAVLASWCGEARRDGDAAVPS
ncbi:hypothetical protein WMY93_007529 [Mugilogobius chulae]|uniref:Uncharacterized protein n=1 Tax=Mugilogobius chulae TaxID=88201 RepID=A0AAW0PD84_9GOBI